MSLTRIPPAESSADDSNRDLPSGIDVVPAAAAAAAMAISSSGDNEGLGRSGFDVLRGTRRWKYNELGRRLADFDEMAVRSAAKYEFESEEEEREKRFLTGFRRRMQSALVVNVSEQQTISSVMIVVIREKIALNALNNFRQRFETRLIHID